MYLSLVFLSIVFPVNCHISMLCVCLSFFVKKVNNIVLMLSHDSCTKYPAIYHSKFSDNYIAMETGWFCLSLLANFSLIEPYFWQGQNEVIVKF